MRNWSGGRYSRGFQGVIRTLGRIVWTQLGQTLMKGVGRDQEFRVAELCARYATLLE